MPVMLTEDTSIDYDVHGEEPPLILINGLGFGRWVVQANPCLLTPFQHYHLQCAGGTGPAQRRRRPHRYSWRRWLLNQVH